MSKRELFNIIDRLTFAKGRRAARETWMLLAVGLILVVGGITLFLLAVTGTWPR
jgi:hypothetical protein